VPGALANRNRAPLPPVEPSAPDRAGTRPARAAHDIKGEVCGVNVAFLRRRRIERYAQLLDPKPGARRQHSRDAVDDHLYELITAHRLLTAERAAFETSVAIDPGRRMEIRDRILSDPELLGIAAATRAGAVTGLHPVVPVTAAHAREAVSDLDTDSAVGRARVAAARRSGPPTREFAAVRRGRFQVRVRARVAVLVGLAVGTLAVSGISAASGSALPGDPLYGLKRSTENAQLALTGSDVSKGKLYLQLAGVRLAEAEAVHANHDELTSTLGAMDSQTRSGVALLFGEALSHRDTKSLALVDTFVTSQQAELRQLQDLVGTGPDRSRMNVSWTVLETARFRAQEIKDALACGLTTSSQHDGFGPVPAVCPK
jgi:hypothetical protein